MSANRRAKRDPIETELNRCSCIKGMTFRGSPSAPIGIPAASGLLRALRHYVGPSGIALSAPVYAHEPRGAEQINVWVSGLCIEQRIAVIVLSARTDSNAATVILC